MSQTCLLFTTNDCSVCPQLKKQFSILQQKLTTLKLEEVNLSEHPEQASKYDIRSVPSYLIHDQMFSGLRTAAELEKLFSLGERGLLGEQIKALVEDGKMNQVMPLVLADSNAVRSVFDLLLEENNALNLRIGLSALVESLDAESLQKYLQQILQMTEHDDESIAIDGCYYLSLLPFPEAVSQLKQLAISSRMTTQQQAKELLAELAGVQSEPEMGAQHG